MLEASDDFMLAIATVLPLLMIAVIVDVSGLRFVVPRRDPARPNQPRPPWWAVVWSAWLNIGLIGFIELGALYNMAQPVDDRYPPTDWILAVGFAMVFTMSVSILRRRIDFFADDPPEAEPTRTRPRIGLAASQKTRRISRRPL